MHIIYILAIIHYCICIIFNLVYKFGEMGHNTLADILVWQTGQLTWSVHYFIIHIVVLVYSKFGDQARIIKLPN